MNLMFTNLFVYVLEHKPNFHFFVIFHWHSEMLFHYTALEASEFRLPLFLCNNPEKWIGISTELNFKFYKANMEYMLTFLVLRWFFTKRKDICCLSLRRCTVHCKRDWWNSGAKQGFSLLYAVKIFALWW